MQEGVDISYTKFPDSIDNRPYDVVQPLENQLYVGWTETGEMVQPHGASCRSGFYNRIFSRPQIAAEAFRSM
jgi:hypothetical protein